MSVDWYVPSHDGSLVACGVTAGGDEQSDVHVLDVESGSVVEELPECGRTNPLMFAWTDDGFYYVRTGAIDDADDSGGDGNGDGDSDGDGEGQLSKELCYHDLGTDPADDRVLKADFDPQTWPTVSTDVDGEYAFSRSRSAGNEPICTTRRSAAKSSTRSSSSRTRSSNRTCAGTTAT